MRAIYKYHVPLTPDVTSELDLPEDARIVRFGHISNQLFVWAIADLERKIVTRRFRVYGTGRPIRESVESEYIGTAINYELFPTLVWHLFEEK